MKDLKEASHDYDSKNNWLSFSVYDKLPESFKIIILNS